MPPLSPSESYYTYRSSDTVAGRPPHVDDVRAGRSPWHGGLGEVLSGTLGLRVVQILGEEVALPNMDGEGRKEGKGSGFRPTSGHKKHGGKRNLCAGAASQNR